MNRTHIFSIVQLVAAFQVHFHITSIIVLQNEEADLSKILVDGLRKTLDSTYLSVYDLKTFVEISQTEFFSQTAMVLSLYPTWMGNNSLTDWFWDEMKFKMSQFVWLSVTNDTNYFSNVYIPFDCEFLISEMTDQNFSKNFEIYRTGYNSNLYYSEFGVWNSEIGLQVKKSSFDLRRTDLHGQELLVYHEDALPDGWFSVTATELFTNASFDIGKRLNAKIIFTVDENAPFDLNVVPNRIFTGQSLGPIFIFRYDIFFKAPSRSFSWNNYFKPFSTLFWITMIFTSVKWFIILIIIYKSLSYVHQLPIKKIKRNISIFEVIIADTEDKAPTYISATIIFIFKIIGAIILTSAYSAVFMSFVIVVIPKPPFTTLDGIVDNGNYKILAIPSRSYVYYQLAVEDPAIKALGEKYLIPKEQQVWTYDEAFDLVCYSGKNYVTDFPAKLANELRLKMNKCRISDVTIKLIYGPGSWYTKENSSFHRTLNFWSLRLIEAGTLDPMVWKRSSSLRQFEANPPIRPIDIIDCGLLLIILALGLCLSIIVFYLERFYHKLMKPKHKRLKKRYAVKKWKGHPFLM